MWREYLVEIVLECPVHPWLLNVVSKWETQSSWKLRAEIGMIDIEGAILYGDANKGVADITEMFIDC